MGLFALPLVSHAGGMQGSTMLTYYSFAHSQATDIEYWHAGQKNKTKIFLLC